jgi:hypothetical protein|tara:strand:+ start:622 stop:1017 length:396 start_codon:yes stop_codon:yes gene_type:complete
MINRILNLGSAALLYFSMATVASILMIATVLWSRGYFSGERAFQILSVMYGIDMAELRDGQMISSDRNSTEMASLDDVIAARAMKSLDLDLREQAFEKGVTDLHDMRVQLAEERRRYNLMKRSFDDELTRL